MGKDAHAPGFYVHLAPDEIFYGGGIWHPPSPNLLKIREAISADAAGWKKATKSAAFERRFGGVRGDQLTRPPRGFSPDERDIEDIKRKSFFAMTNAKTAAPKKPAFAGDVEAAFKDAKPLMKFLCEALDVPF